MLCYSPERGGDVVNSASVLKGRSLGLEALPNTNSCSTWTCLTKSFKSQYSSKYFQPSVQDKSFYMAFSSLNSHTFSGTEVNQGSTGRWRLRSENLYSPLKGSCLTFFCLVRVCLSAGLTLILYCDLQHDSCFLCETSAPERILVWTGWWKMYCTVKEAALTHQAFPQPLSWPSISTASIFNIFEELKILMGPVFVYYSRAACNTHKSLCYCFLSYCFLD